MPATSSPRATSGGSPGSRPSSGCSVGENLDNVHEARETALSFAAGHTVAELTTIGEEVFDEVMAAKVWPGTRALAQMHLDAGQRVWLVTATPVEVAGVIARRLGLTGALGTVAETGDGVYTGRLVGEILHGEAKAEAVRALAEREGLDLAGCSAYSDSANDIPLLSMVGQPCAINPDGRSCGRTPASTAGGCATTAPGARRPGSASPTAAGRAPWPEQLAAASARRRTADSAGQARARRALCDASWGCMRLIWPILLGPRLPSWAGLRDVPHTPPRGICRPSRLPVGARENGDDVRVLTPDLTVALADAARPGARAPRPAVRGAHRPRDGRSRGVGTLPGSGLRARQRRASYARTTPSGSAIAALVTLAQQGDGEAFGLRSTTATSTRSTATSTTGWVARSWRRTSPPRRSCGRCAGSTRSTGRARTSAPGSSPSRATWSPTTSSPAGSSSRSAPGTCSMPTGLTTAPSSEVLDRTCATPSCSDAVKQLKPEQQECIVLRFLQGLTAGRDRRSHGRSRGCDQAAAAASGPGAGEAAPGAGRMISPTPPVTPVTGRRCQVARRARAGRCHDRRGVLR